MICRDKGAKLQCNIAIAKTKICISPALKYYNGLKILVAFYFTTTIYIICFKNGKHIFKIMMICLIDTNVSDIHSMPV